METVDPVHAETVQRPEGGSGGAVSQDTGSGFALMLAWVPCCLCGALSASLEGDMSL